MKFSINITLLCFTAISFAAPLMNTMAERSDDIDTREWIDLEVRAGPFAPEGRTTSVKKAAHTFIDNAQRGGQLSRASAGGSSAKTAKADGAFHLDRQQPTNANGQHKVAVQLNRVKDGAPSTVGQVAIHGHANPSSRQVAKKLKHSVTTGKETHINHPDSKKAKNIAKNQARQQDKATRIQGKQQAGMKKAAQGQYRKGRK